MLLTLGTACPDDAAAPSTTVSPGQPGQHEPATTSFGPNEPTPTTAAPTTGDTTEATSTGPSTTTAAEPVCGDGHPDPGEECDHGADNANTGACTLECKHALCGDGLVWAGVEACDFGLGNADAYGGCRPDDCQFAARCGDGILDIEFETCDLGDLNGTGASPDGMAPCSPTCRFHGRPVFVTSQAYSGDLGGLSGADLKCQARAAGVGLAHPHTYRAWLADGFDGPGDRFEQKQLAGVPYLRLDGRVIAADYDELITLGPRTGITLTELGELLVEEWVWTNTSAFGDSFSPDNHCSHWTTSNPELSARLGKNAVAVEDGPAWQTWRDERHWTSYLGRKCNETYRLYCFDDGFVAEEEG
ncbi:hypothetical protein [Nannocystis pusilla]|uniref:Uncharacterized protein n=1 Tax=Nannocystis pusilla TaxID=889268 RepID=A0ABS7U1U1_9BACT|nr:hypothetical protein [Nannocystis pusilla]MBZ5714495.1 hypothetical protein [Nannocystis pusilla]